LLKRNSKKYVCLFVIDGDFFYLSTTSIKIGDELLVKSQSISILFRAKTNILLCWTLRITKTKVRNYHLLQQLLNCWEPFSFVTACDLQLKIWKTNFNVEIWKLFCLFYWICKIVETAWFKEKRKKLYFCSESNMC